MTHILRRFLVVNADGSARVVTRPRYAEGTRTYRLTITVPDARSFAGTIEVEAPQGAVASLDAS